METPRSKTRRGENRNHIPVENPALHVPLVAVLRNTLKQKIYS
jgi:hypothetical protein